MRPVILLMFPASGDSEVYSISDSEVRISTTVSYMCYNQRGPVEGFDSGIDLSWHKFYQLSSPQFAAVDHHLLRRDLTFAVAGTPICKIQTLHHILFTLYVVDDEIADYDADFLFLFRFVGKFAATVESAHLKTDIMQIFEMNSNLKATHPIAIEVGNNHCNCTME
ncbi:hypothetical protein L1987_37663 [Smallanthus sonchifolius]|uniref:Uncharacterized protein n=1 Tax=Smallanthus sonchifolius TaxID=185202 RepID=A0ACB9HIT5_9ASTR|nr:hypothetical protein L1987_37663 [Smallanthus sonchifolius]